MAIILAFLNKYIAYLRWGVLLFSWVAIAWSVHHIDGLVVKAAMADHQATVIKSIPEVITKTQVITKVIHDANDKCAASAIPATVLDVLH